MGVWSVDLWLRGGRRDLGRIDNWNILSSVAGEADVFVASNGLWFVGVVRYAGFTVYGDYQLWLELGGGGRLYGNCGFGS